jgi:hypothetical protein
MLRFILLSLITTQAFAQTECYFDNKFEDGTIGFFLEEKSITLIQPYRKFTRIEKDGSDLIKDGRVVGKLRLFFPRGIIELGDELSSYQCTIWRTGGRG